MSVRERVFGSEFTPSAEYARKVLRYYVANDIINQKGFLITSKYTSTTKSSLWGYLYLIWSMNKQVMKCIRYFVNDMSSLILHYIQKVVDPIHQHKYIHNNNLICITRDMLFHFTYCFLQIPHLNTSHQKELLPKDFDSLIKQQEYKYATLLYEIEKKISKPIISSVRRNNKQSTLASLRIV